MTRFTLLPLAIYINIICLNIANAETTTQLDQITVTTSAENANVLVKNRHQLQQEIINNAQDLIRYTSDIGINNEGRHQKGFTIRGVEGNRVGISIDNIALPDSQENAIFARYGNFNSSRIFIDPELVKQIEITRGSDTFNAGSGALGGNVNYRTLEASDIVSPHQHFGLLLKSGYTSKNQQWHYTTGTAYQDNKFEAVLLYTNRNGHQLKSLGNGQDIYGAGRGIPDPSHHQHHNYLAKFAYLFNDTHRLSLSYNGQRHQNYTEEKSYVADIGDWRNVKDKIERDTLNLHYEYFPQSAQFISYLKAGYNWQKTITQAINYKGSTHFNRQTLNKIDDRQMHTHLNQFTLQMESIPFESRFGTHTLQLKTAYGQHRFSNINHDVANVGTNKQNLSHYTIQYPIHQQQITFALQDNIQWNTQLISQLGLRYDATKLTPKSLNAICYSCAETKPHTAHFNNFSGQFDINYQFNPIWTIGYHLANGYRIPSASEMFFSYEYTGGGWLANPHLKPERSLNQAIKLQADHLIGQGWLQLYHSNYRNFLHQKSFYVNGLNYRQAINLTQADIQGIELQGTANLDQLITAIPTGWNTMAAVGYSKGKLKGTTESLLTVQPLKLVFGLGYNSPNKDWQIQSRFTYLGAKKGKEAQILQDTQQTQGETFTFPYLNQSVWLFDLFGSVQTNKYLTLHAGVYNLFNRKYQTWDSLRSINLQGSINSVDQAGKGLARFYEAGRNFAVSLEAKF